MSRFQLAALFAACLAAWSAAAGDEKAPPAAKPGPPPPVAPKVAQPQPKGCPPGKSMAVVNGQPVCK